MQRLISLITSLTTLSLLLLFAGCGQSGPLYIPGNPSTMAVPPERPVDESNEEESAADPSNPDQ